MKTRQALFSLFCASLASAFVVLVPVEVEAKSEKTNWPRIGRHALVVSELIFPDLRVEIYGQQPAQLVYSWPIVWSALRLGFGPNDPCPNRVMRWVKTRRDAEVCQPEWSICLDCPEDRAGYFLVLPFLEAQWVSQIRDVRGLGGVRLSAGHSDHPVGLALEGGALLGTDGHGGFVGGGLSRRLERSGVSASVMGRYVWTDQENRLDFTIDLQVPINWPGL